MKLANIPQDITVVHYAQEHNYEARRYVTFSKFPQIIPMFNFVVEKARKEGCVEFIFEEAKDRFNLMNDEHDWRISIIGFLLKN